MAAVEHRTTPSSAFGCIAARCRRTDRHDDVTGTVRGSVRRILAMTPSGWRGVLPDVRTGGGRKNRSPSPVPPLSMIAPRGVKTSARR